MPVPTAVCAWHKVVRKRSTAELGQPLGQQVSAAYYQELTYGSLEAQ